MHAVTGSEESDVPEESLGKEIAMRRRALGLTLKQVAARTGLSQPFLSQIERGVAQPSMRSLSAIANALGTSGPVLLAGTRYHELTVGGRPGSEAPSSDGGVDHTKGVARSLVHGDAPVGVTEFVGIGPQEEGDWWSHDGQECLYVAQGAVELQLGDAAPRILHARDSFNYDGSVPHKWRMVGAGMSIVIEFSYPNFEWGRSRER